MAELFIFIYNIAKLLDYKHTFIEKFIAKKVHEETDCTYNSKFT